MHNLFIYLEDLRAQVRCSVLLTIVVRQHTIEVILGRVQDSASTVQCIIAQKVDVHLLATNSGATAVSGTR